MENQIKPATQLRVVSVKEKTGFRGVSIQDADGLFIANMVGQLDDSERVLADRLVHACNTLPKLEDENRRLREELRSIRSEIEFGALSDGAMTYGAADEVVERINNLLREFGESA